ncbi:MAG: aromatic ring-hydroxylating dioxygenase subunit alpha [Pigmentiphaga sp.]|uniref:aromatic ring-hydroxylating dioxygenase subunit alpha n=1 Tax=Pigmentiphaga sp. TaxID=1977564 RepID=UPI0029A4ECED|nr:aromatic ring-hydroxylating dioxygenase subunit alpha [Pigmentiphaga sp.]MDX3906329.1 aromatic ring-hydroxylating dioxygenase subunit alpha [Pigmentiphaga sp.]
MSFLRNAWYVALWGQDLAPGELAARTILGEPLVLFRNAAGEARALFGICPHRFAPMQKGSVRPDGRVQCGYHGLQFDQHGECVHNPHGAAPASCRLRAYPVVEKDTIVWVWMGNEPPRPDRIPDFSFLQEQPGQVASRREWLTMKASYRLVLDNLLDLSHVPYLHEGLLGNASTVKADTRVEERGDEVFVSRDKFDVTPPGLLDKLFRNDGQPVHAWQTIRWTPPSNFKNDSGVYPVNGVRSDGAGLLSAHLLTPIDEFNTMYHFAAVRQGVPLPPERNAEELAVQLTELRRQAFEHQDEPMIEAQQEVIRRFPQFTARQCLLKSDAGVVRANRLLDKLIEEERQAGAPVRHGAGFNLPG